MIKAIIFDYGGVLSTNVTLLSFGEMYAAKLEVNPEKFKEIIIDNWDQARINRINSRLFWSNLSNFLKIDKKTLRRDWVAFFKLRPKALTLVKKLKKNYKLGLLSNHIEDWLEEIIENHKLNQIFDVIVTSYRSRLAKPDIDIFRETIKRLNVKSTECIYIDDMEKNIPPAKELGMKTILFRDLRQLKKELVSFGVRID